MKTVEKGPHYCGPFLCILNSLYEEELALVAVEGS